MQPQIRQTHVTLHLWYCLLMHQTGHHIYWIKHKIRRCPRQTHYRRSVQCSNQSWDRKCMRSRRTQGRGRNKSAPRTSSLSDPLRKRFDPVISFLTLNRKQSKSWLDLRMTGPPLSHARTHCNEVCLQEVEQLWRINAVQK